MIYTKLTKTAMNLAYIKHANQLDKAGLPYVFHPLHVAEQMDDEASTVVALLHDVLEDTDTTVNEIRLLGFSNEIIQALSVLTHDGGVSYQEYIKTIAKNPLATKVKIADLEHNADLTRLDNVSEQDKLSQQKYIESLSYLRGIS